MGMQCVLLCLGAPRSLLFLLLFRLPNYVCLRAVQIIVHRDEAQYVVVNVPAEFGRPDALNKIASRLHVDEKETVLYSSDGVSVKEADSFIQNGHYFLSAQAAKQYSDRKCALPAACGLGS